VLGTKASRVFVGKERCVHAGGRDEAPQQDSHGGVTLRLLPVLPQTISLENTTDYFSENRVFWTFLSPVEARASSRL
jgi:hypothetical protein